MYRFLHVLLFVITIFLTSCGDKPSAEPLPTNEWGCSSTTVKHETYSEIIFDCPPSVWERMMAWHLAFHPSENLIVDP